MVDKADLRNMIMTFRVSELQLLLGLTSQSRYGRKTELLQRALALVENGVPVPVQLKIRELYQKFTPRVPGCNATFSVAQNSVGRTNINSGTVHKGLCELLGQNNQTAQNVSYPEVKFKHLPFYDLLGEIIRPVCLAPRNSAKQQETRISFCLTEQQIQEITMSRTGFGSNKVEFNIQVQLRFCVMDTAARQPDCFPSNITVKVNGSLAPLPNPVPTNKPGVQPKRPSRPVDITTLCRFSTSINNNITVSWMIEENKNYCLAVYLVKRLDSSILLQRLRRNGACKPDQTRMMIREKLSLDCDAELATTSLRVSLRCPLGKVRMKLPCRAVTCNHLQCFDAETFLQMNEKRPTWICPICDRPAEFNKLIIDGLFLEIIQNSPDSTEIELSQDGQWQVTGTEDIDENSCSSPRAEAMELQATMKSLDGLVIDLTESDDDLTYPSDSKSHLQALTKNYAASTQSKRGTVSPPSLSSPRAAICDYSPHNSVSSPPRHSITPDLVSDLSLPILPPPLAHCNYQPFALSSKLHSVPPAAPPMLPPPAFAGFPAMVGGLHTSPYSALYGGGFDGLMQSDASIMELLTLMSSMPEYSLAHPQFALPNGLFDYLYGPRTDSSLERRSPNS